MNSRDNILPRESSLPLLLRLVAASTRIQMLLGGVGGLDFLGESGIDDVAVNAARGAASAAVAARLLGAKAVGLGADQGIRDSHFEGGFEECGLLVCNWL